MVVWVRARGKEFPVLFAVQRTIPQRGRKLLVKSGEFGADWRDPLAFLVFLARTAEAHKTRRKGEEKDQMVPPPSSVVRWL